MSIRIVASLEPRSERERKQLTKMVVKLLVETGSLGRSASGMTLAMAVAWCEENVKPYRITAFPGAGYTLELIDGGAR